ncbi:MAG: holin [Clostridiales bacterium]|nr:holin [Clostridiales bacterium]
MLERIKSASFWVELIGAVFLILGAFGVEIGDEVASTVVNGICSVLIMLGIVVPSKPRNTTAASNDDGSSAESDDGK